MANSFLIDDPSELKIIVDNSGTNPAYKLEIKGHSFSLDTSYITVRIQKSGQKFFATVDLGTQAPSVFDNQITLNADYHDTVFVVNKNEDEYAQIVIILDDTTIMLKGQTHTYSLEDQELTLHTAYQSSSLFQYQFWSKKL